MSAKSPAGELMSVNVSDVQEVEHNGRVVTTGIFKTPTTAPQEVAGVHVGADRQADTNSHGGQHKAVYAYASEDYQWWSSQMGREFAPGLFGENLTTVGVDVSAAKIGERWHIGSTVLEVSEPRVPCFKLGIAVSIPRFIQQFAAADRPGAYLRIIQPGQLVVGDVVEIEAAKETMVTVSDVSAIYHRERDRAAQLIDVPGLSDAWRSWASETKEKHS